MVHRTLMLAVSVCCLLAASVVFGAKDTTTTKPKDAATAPAVKAARAPVKPTSGTPQSATPRAVSTFESIGLYWSPEGGAEDKTCKVQYRAAGEQAWRDALPLWFDKRISEYRGSIVLLKSNTNYEIQLTLPDKPAVQLKAVTWNEDFPIAKTIEVDDITGKALKIDQSGTANGYVLYTHRKGVPTATISFNNKPEDCTEKSEEQVQGAYDPKKAKDGDNGVEVKASYVIIRGLTIKSPKVCGIVLGEGCHDIVIEDCDISGWGRIHPDGWGVDLDSAIFSRYEPLTRVVVQRCYLHDPRSDSNSWQEQRQYGGNKNGPTKHPMGPQGICFFESAGNNVLRYNDFMTDDQHYCNDIFGGSYNTSLRGYLGVDSDVYGNHIEGCWDDGLEMEGAGCNLRVWGNYINRTMVKIAIAGLSVGPTYIFRNVAGISKFGHEGPDGGPFVKMGHSPFTGGGRAYIFHNTILQPLSPDGKPMGCETGLSKSGGPEMLSIVSRNNILHVREGSSILDKSKEPSPEWDYDYDLLSAAVTSAGEKEQHGVKGLPVYAKGKPEGDFSLEPGSPGYEAGVAIPNFSDGFSGKAPDMGAFEHGSAPMEFGRNAYLKSASSQPAADSKK